MPQELDFQSYFNVFLGDTIQIPANTIFYRGQDPQYAAVPTRPAYQGSKLTAQGYADISGRKFGTFMTTRSLHVVDIRFLKIILKHILGKKLLEKGELSQEDKNASIALTLSFGLSSLGHQLELIHKELKHSLNLLAGVRNMEKMQNPESIIEQPGVRIAETSLDAITMGILQTLFSNEFDGQIAPKILSSFHVEKEKNILSSELIIFNPIESGIKMIQNGSYSLPKLTLSSIIDEKCSNRRFKTNIFNIPFKMKGGGSNNLNKKHYLDKLDEEINKMNRNVIHNQNNGLRIGARWAKKQTGYLNDINFKIPPGPDLGMNIFNTIRL